MVLRSDGGGVVAAARQPVEGAPKVARFLLGLAAKVTQRLGAADPFTATIADVDGAPGILLHRPRGTLLGTLALGVADGRVTTVDTVVNPAKLPRP